MVIISKNISSVDLDNLPTSLLLWKEEERWNSSVKLMFKCTEIFEHLQQLLIGAVLCWSEALRSDLMKYARFGIDSLKDLEEPGDDEVIHHCVFPQVNNLKD